MKTIDITVTRIIHASPEQVYDVWLDPKGAGPWSGSQRLILNTAVDGMFFIAMENKDKAWPHYGRFIRLERGRTIEHTWMSMSTHGLESTVTITLAAKGDKTELVLHHTGLPDNDDGRDHERGWNWFVGRAAERFER